ncbi:hypothetical protein EVAR_3564_1 [Eumeta japonica]|uniref:Uncharacterized protein n=1 Tax=Eumeta variegata TaxID=151549 RepID=A0A4C1SWA4_EUMVA|nr:hypothetical protein EVAR_3564_1 [Eumeta japonica]
MRSLRSMCGVSRKDRCRNSDVRERCGLKEEVVNRVERGTRTNDSRLTKKRYKANVCGGKVSKGRPRKTDADHIGGILKKGQILRTRNQRACMKRLLDGSEAREVCKDRIPCGNL